MFSSAVCEFTCEQVYAAFGHELSCRMAEVMSQVHTARTESGKHIICSVRCDCTCMSFPAIGQHFHGV